MGKARDFKFSVHIDRQAYKPKNAKVRQKVRGLRHVTYFYYFYIPAKSVKRLNLQTSNFCISYKILDYNKNSEKFAPNGHDLWVCVVLAILFC